jgi:Ca-activated chloride channel family protein
VQAERYKTTVVAVATEAKPVVLDTTDREVIRNILTELPMRHAFKPGETNMFAGLEEAAKLAKPWPPGSAVLMVVTDGDTVPTTGMPKMPASIGNNVVMVGVGNPTVGQVARRAHDAPGRLDAAAGGDAAERRVPRREREATDDGADLAHRREGESRRAGTSGRRASTRSCASGSGWACWRCCPALLTLLGTGWEPGRRPSRGERGA